MIRLDDRAVYRRRSELVTREVAGEVLVVPVSGQLADLQRIFALDRVAAFIWERLDGRCPLVSIREAVVAAFQVPPETAERDLVEFVEEVLAAGLIDEVSTDYGMC
jgi:hypothetical protein